MKVKIGVNKIGILAVLLQALAPGIAPPRTIVFSGPLFAQEAGLSPAYLAFLKGGAERNGRGGGKTMEMGAGQGWAEHNARVSVGHHSFWEPARTPSWGPRQDTGICGQCKTGPSAPLPLSSSCQHPPVTCPCTLWK